MEELNKDEILEKLQEQVAEDLKDAQIHEWAIDEQDAKYVSELKEKLSNTLAVFQENKKTIEKSNHNNTIWKTIYTRLLNGERVVINDEIEELLKSNLELINKGNEDNARMLETIEEREPLIEKAVELLSYKLDDNGKAYVDDTTIQFAKLIMKM